MNHISFIKLDDRSRKTLLYNSSMPLGDAIQLSYKLGHKDIQTEVAFNLRNNIFDAYRKSDELPWPPSADFLVNLNNVLPTNVSPKCLVLGFKT